MNVKTLKDLDVKDKVVLLRADLNVPQNRDKVIDDTRISATLPTIEYLLSNNCRIILVSHLGRPKGQVVQELRLDSVASRLSNLLPQVEVLKSDQIIGEKVTNKVKSLTSSQILVLENIRFDPREETNDLEFSKKLSELADVFINDAFGTLHRAHASTVGVTKYLPSACGFLVEREVEVLERALTNPSRPFTAIIGGAKVKDKIGVIENILDRVDNLIIGGGLSYTFLKALGYNIGKSLFEEDKERLAKDLIIKAHEKKVNLYLPIDALCSKEISQDVQTELLGVKDIRDELMGLDIGEKSCKLFTDVIKESSLVVWNGPMGVFEIEQFSLGTLSLAHAISEMNGTSIIGGGDSISAIKKSGLEKSVDHILTGGGASLEYLEGKILPGLACLQK